MYTEMTNASSLNSFLPFLSFCRFTSSLKSSAWLFVFCVFRLLISVAYQSATDADKVRNKRHTHTHTHGNSEFPFAGTQQNRNEAHHNFNAHINTNISIWIRRFKWLLHRPIDLHSHMNMHIAHTHYKTNDDYNDRWITNEQRIYPQHTHTTYRKPMECNEKILWQNIIHRKSTENFFNNSSNSNTRHIDRMFCVRACLCVWNVICVD